MEKKSNELRRQIKKKKPDFIRQDGHKKVRLGQKWRKPKGIQNKVRLNMRGYRRMVTKGYKSPSAVRGLSRDGYVPILVYNVKNLEGIDNKKDAIIVSRSVGQRNKLQILQQAKAANIVVLNLKAEDKIAKIEEEMNKRKSAKKKKIGEKKAKEKKVAEPVKKEESKSKKLEDTLEEEKDKEKKEKEKLLIKKNMKG